MKSKRSKFFAGIGLIAILCMSGISAYAACLECSNYPNRPCCVNDKCDMVFINGSMCCGNSI